MKTVNVDSLNPYQVLIDRGIFNRLSKYIKNHDVKYLILTDSNVDALYGERAMKQFVDLGIEAIKYVVPSGETSKSFHALEELMEFMADNLFSRSDILIALGGGVIGDLGGFAAAIYQRGIEFIQIPTTLLAAVDSSVGGKTAVNLRAGKNLVGAFKQPKMVLCDPDMLQTLAEEDFRSGVAEVIKYAVLFDGDLLDILNSPVDSKTMNLDEIIRVCVQHKADIVKEDEFEAGKRQLLNLGHTIGHSIEKLSDYTLRHGYAVSIGMAIIARADLNEGNLSQESYKRIINTIKINNLPTKTAYPVDKLYDNCKGDKKSRGDKLNVVRIKDISDPFIETIKFEELYGIIEKGVENDYD